MFRLRSVSYELMMLLILSFKFVLLKDFNCFHDIDANCMWQIASLPCKKLNGHTRTIMSFLVLEERLCIIDFICEYLKSLSSLLSSFHSFCRVGIFSPAGVFFQCVQKTLIQWREFEFPKDKASTNYLS